MSLILYYFKSMLPYMAEALPPVLLFRLLRSRGLKRRGLRTTLRHEIGLCLFLLFCAGLASQTIVPDLILTEHGLEMTGSSVEPFNLIPFRVIRNIWRYALHGGNQGYFFVNIFGNILLFLPFGFFPALLWNRPGLARAAGLSLAVSLGIELCQLFQPRVSDVDDLILNVAGGLLGYGCFCLFRRFRPDSVQKWRVTATELVRLSVS